MFRAPPYPLFLDLAQHPVLVVGAGAVGYRKTRNLLECAARVTVVSPAFSKNFDSLPDVERVKAPYARTHMTRQKWRLVFAATDVAAVNEQVHKHARAAGILCCRADDHADFSGGAAARVGAKRKAHSRGARAAGSAGGIVLAVSTSGSSPVLAARICREAVAGIDPVLPMLADLLDAWRTRIKTHLPNGPLRRQLLQRLAGDEMEKILRKNGAQAAQRAFRQWYDDARAQAAAAADAAPQAKAP